MRGGQKVSSVGRLMWLARVRRIRAPASWGILLALFLGAVGARVAFALQLDAVPFSPFFLAVLVAAWVCGWRKTLILLAASAIAGWRRFHGNPWELEPSFDARVITFLVTSGLAIALIESLMQTVLRLELVVRLNQELFRELQHRVANNFQIVAATLQKARGRVADPAAIEAVDHAASRIVSLARLHRRLYDPTSYEKGLAPILREVLEETFHGLDVDLQFDLSGELLSMGQMTSIVLLVNEAAINSAKHVFRLDRGRTFAISLHVDKAKHTLTIRDDGPGFGPTVAETSNSRYGLAVMRGLANQLGGVFEIVDEPGAVIRVAF